MKLNSPEPSDDSVLKQLSPLYEPDDFDLELFIQPEAAPDRAYLFVQSSVVFSEVPPHFGTFTHGPMIAGNVPLYKDFKVGAFRQEYPVLDVAACKHGCRKIQMLRRFGLN